MTTTTKQPSTLSKKALLQKAKARLTGDDSSAAEMFLLAVKLGVPSAKITFSGGGDSGDFDDADLIDIHHKIRDETQPDTYVYIDNPKWTQDHDTLTQLVKDVAEKWVEGTGADWYNNDGGGGEVSFDFKTGEVSGSLYQNVTEQETVVDETWSLLSDEEGGDE